MWSFSSPQRTSSSEGYSGPRLRCCSSAFLTCGFLRVSVHECVRLRGRLQGVSEDGIPRVKKNTEREEMFAFYSCRFSICKTALHTHTYQRRNKEPRLWYQNTYERSGPARCDRETALTVIRLEALSPPHLFMVGVYFITTRATKPLHLRLSEGETTTIKQLVVKLRSCCL